MFGFRKSAHFVLTGQKTELRLPQSGDYITWKQTRIESKAELVPFEPKWAEHELSRPVFNARVKQAKRLAEDKEAFNFSVLN